MGASALWRVVEKGHVMQLVFVAFAAYVIATGVSGQASANLCLQQTSLNREYSAAVLQAAVDVALDLMATHMFVSLFPNRLALGSRAPSKP